MTCSLSLTNLVRCGQLYNNGAGAAQTPTDLEALLPDNKIMKSVLP